MNHGCKEVAISGIVTWEVRSIGALQWVTHPPDNDRSTSTPARLQHGGDVVLIHSTDYFPRTARLLLQWLASRWFPRLALRRLRVCLHATTGQQFSTHLDKAMRKWLLEQLSVLGLMPSGQRFVSTDHATGC